MWITLFGMLVASLVAAAPLVLYSLWNIFLLLTMGVFLLLVGILLSLQSEWLRARLVFYQGDAVLSPSFFIVDFMGAPCVSWCVVV
jgi:hypothetical protein